MINVTLWYNNNFNNQIFELQMYNLFLIEKYFLLNTLYSKC